MSKFLVITLLATVALTLIVPTVTGISLLQQAKAARSGERGNDGSNACINTDEICSQ